MKQSLGSVLSILDGPLALRPDEGREATVRRMAADLVRYDAFQNEADAIRCLMAKGHSPYHVLKFIDDARQVAQQDVVAREISKS